MITFSTPYGTLSTPSSIGHSSSDTVIATTCRSASIFSAIAARWYATAIAKYCRLTWPRGRGTVSQIRLYQIWWITIVLTTFTFFGSTNSNLTNKFKGSAFRRDYFQCKQLIIILNKNNCFTSACIAATLIRWLTWSITTTTSGRVRIG